MILLMAGVIVIFSGLRFFRGDNPAAYMSMLIAIYAVMLDIAIGIKKSKKHDGGER